MAGEALRPVKRDWLDRFTVWIVARAAPHLAQAAGRALAQRKLLGMADHLEIAGVRRYIGCENFFQGLAWIEIGKTLSRIQYTDHSR